MNNIHEILHKIPHEQIQSKCLKTDERFDVFKLGVFNVTQSILDFISGRSIKQADEVVELVKLQPKSQYRLHYHQKSSAVLYMILGEGVFILGENEIPYKPEMRLDLPEKTPHGFLTDTETLFLSIQTPSILNRQTGEVDLHYVE